MIGPPEIVIRFRLEQRPTFEIRAIGDDLGRLLAWLSSPSIARELRSAIATLRPYASGADEETA